MSPEFVKYLKLIGLVIYTSFIDQFEQTIPPNPTNVNKISLIDNAPSKRKRPLYFCNFTPTIPHLLTLTSR